ncbi:hypothetical protein DWB85_14075 [Seongchinamella sediminis]|uniref:Uncharacterized protein n=1 Tax=Seongchinamella sediminis TaxID=2283635 RepID=A0A3L7DYK4_9GAMM|nr:hypothetical protein [Seongchinamella sediminis]RLQ21203.1 hypothetical protein DWB85_14075 [Seongchinamella sediminis]
MEQQEVTPAPQSSGLLLLRQAALHLALWILAFCLFAASDSWVQLTGWRLAAVLNVLTGISAGFVTVNLVHEWCHYLGARAVSASYTVNPRPGMFVFDWTFEDNSLRQFYIMSAAGSLGGLLALLLVFSAVDADSAGRAALGAGAVASFAFGSLVEWPVLLRTRRSHDPLAELSRLNPRALARAGAGSAIAGLLTWIMLA